MRIIVVGAGIVGLATAWTLARAGHEVRVVESSAGSASGASGQNGAQLSYAFVAPLAAPSVLRQLPRLLFDRRSPLRFAPPLTWHQARWCLQFLRACTAQQGERTTALLLDLAALSRERFGEWLATIDPASIEHRRNGKLVVYRDEDGWRAAQAQLALQRPLGPQQRACSPEECLSIEPALAAGSGRIVGGVFTPGEEVADCRLVCDALSREVAVQYGARAHAWVIERGEVRALELFTTQGVQQLRADAFVVASGAAVPSLLAPLGVDAPIVPLKGYSLEMPLDSVAAMPAVSVTDSAAKVVFAPLGDGSARRLRVAGMAELVGANLRIDDERIAQLAESTARVFGVGRAGAAHVRPWAGLRPATPTGRPCIGPAGRWRNVWINGGQGALGFTLAFGSAAVLRAQLEGAVSPLGASAAMELATA